MRMAFPFLVVLGLAAGVGAGAVAAQEGSPLRWILSIKPDTSSIRNPAGRMEIPTKKGGKQVYWYLVYEVKNPEHNEQAVPLALHMRMTTDASAEVFHEGYYPRALKRIREKFGEDVKDSLSLKGHELQPGESVRAVAIFQLFQPGDKQPRKFEERADRLTIHVSGYADVVKRSGRTFEEENLELLLHFTKQGDEYDPHMEAVRFVSSEEKVVPAPES